MAGGSRFRLRPRSKVQAAWLTVLGVGLASLEAAAAEIIRYVDASGHIVFYYRPDPELLPRSLGDSRSSTDREQTLVPLIDKIATENAVDPLLVRAVMRVESDFQADARSPKGATGLMQLMPATAAYYGVDDIYDIEQNIRGGVLFLRHLQDRYGDDLKTLLAAYNAGETQVDRAGGTVPGFLETQQYVVDVLHHYSKRGGLANAPAVLVPARAVVKRPVRRTGEEPSRRPVRIHFDRSGNLVITNVP
jgi:soluble lytic murein transglycosylase-like protein